MGSLTEEVERDREKSPKAGKLQKKKAQGPARSKNQKLPPIKRELSQMIRTVEKKAKSSQCRKRKEFRQEPFRSLLQPPEDRGGASRFPVIEKTHKVRRKKVKKNSGLSQRLNKPTNSPPATKRRKEGKGEFEKIGFLCPNQKSR